MCNEFNELRSEMVLLYELKNALAACEQELHSLKGQFEAACPGKVLNSIVAPIFLNARLYIYITKLFVFIQMTK